MPDVLVATDADWVAEEVAAAVAGPGVTVRRVRAGRDVLPTIEDRLPDLVVLDLQIGNMGGMATCMAIRLEEGVGRLPHLPVLMLLDREPDVFLARRSAADEWMIKPLQPLKLRRVMTRLMERGPSEPHVGPPTQASIEGAAPGVPDGDLDDEPADQPRSWRKRQRHPASG
ncbi:MAG TPA: response regulator [Acidimicrobiales bacterium]|nr:response regulator [Acidimicrobiales bacterium]